MPVKASPHLKAPSKQKTIKQCNPIWRHIYDTNLMNNALLYTNSRKFNLSIVYAGGGEGILKYYVSPGTSSELKAVFYSLTHSLT